MNKLILIVIGAIAVFMVKSAFYISPTIDQFNIWIFVGAAIMLVLAVQNYFLKSKNSPKSLPARLRALNKSYDIKMPSLENEPVWP